MSKLTRKYGKKFVNFKALAVATMAGIASLGATNSAQANETPITPTLGDDASYTLKEVSTPTDNSITLYKYDNTVITEAINYEINLAQTDYGSGDTTLYYKWSKDDSTNKILFVESTSADAQISVSYDSSKVLEKVYGVESAPYPNVEGVFVNLQNRSIYVEDEFLGDVNAFFINSNMSNTAGGAIYNSAHDQGNSSQIGNVSGLFIGNSAYSGGAIENRTYKQNTSAYMGNINATFIGNTSSSDGGAIYNNPNASYGGVNYASIQNITGDFIGNSVFIKSRGNNYGHGGAIANSYVYGSSTATIGDIKGDFIANKVYNNIEQGLSSGTESATTSGGAIANGGEIGSVTGDFLKNAISIKSSSSYVSKFSTVSARVTSNGGAICNTGSIIDITGNFVDNSIFASAYSTATVSTSAYMYSGAQVQAYGGAIYNSGEIGNLVSSFINNSISADVEAKLSNTSAWVAGGAIYNSGMLKDITGNFIGNTIFSENKTSGYGTYTYGGAIYNVGTIGNIFGSFIENKSINNNKGSAGGAIYNSGATIGNITGDFIANEADYGGAIYNVGEYYNSQNSVIGDITGDFIGNNGTNVGGAIYNSSNDYEDKAIIGNVVGDFLNNYVDSTNLEYNYETSGGAIYNNGNIGTLSGNYIGNYAISEYEAQGGAIYNSGNIGTVNAEIQECLQIQVIDPDTGDLLDTLYVTMDNLSQEDVEKGQYKFEIIDQIEIPLGEITGENGETFETVDEFINYASSQGNNVLTQNPVSFAALPISIIDSTFSGNYVSSTDEMIPTSELYVTLRESKYTYRNTTTGESFVVYDLYYDKETIEDLISQGYKIKYEEEYEYEYNISDENWANQKSYCEQNVARGNSSYESRIDEVLDIIPEDAYLKFEPTNNSYGGLVVINTQFDNNSSTGFGGAIANLGEFNNDIGDLTARLVLDNTTFNKNKSGYAGGAIYDYMDVVVRFDKAAVDSLGIGLYNAGPDTSDSDLTNYDNTVTHLDIKSSNFTNNESKLGGAIAGEYFVKISDSIEDRPVEASIMPLDMSPELPTVVEPDNVPDILVNIENSSFAGNKAVKGGALYFDRVHAQVEGIEDAPVPISLGLVESEVEDVSVQDNSTTYISAPDETKYNLTIKNTSFVNNIATSNGNDSANGGAIYTNMNTRIVADGVNSVFSGNKFINCNSE